MRIGDIVELQHPCLGNDAGARGVVYEEYDLGYGPAVSIIFENGNYDGFSPDEQKWVKIIGHEPLASGYEFKNVMQLSSDFERGLFQSCFDY